MKIRATKKVRELLIELDEVFQRYHAANATAANLKTQDAAAVDAGAEMQHLKNQIVGIAWRINRHSRGEGEFKP